MFTEVMVELNLKERNLIHKILSEYTPKDTEETRIIEDIKIQFNKAIL